MLDERGMPNFQGPAKRVRCRSPGGRLLFDRPCLNGYVLREKQLVQRQRYPRTGDGTPGLPPSDFDGKTTNYATFTSHEYVYPQAGSGIDR